MPHDHMVGECRRVPPELYVFNLTEPVTDLYWARVDYVQTMQSSHHPLPRGLPRVFPCHQEQDVVLRTRVCRSLGSEL